MANVTFTIPDSKIQYFVDAYGHDYDEKVASGEIDGGSTTKAQYAKEQAFKFLASYPRKFHKQQQVNQITEIDISQE